MFVDKVQFLKQMSMIWTLRSVTCWTFGAEKYEPIKQITDEEGDRHVPH